MKFYRLIKCIFSVKLIHFSPLKGTLHFYCMTERVSKLLTTVWV